MKLQDLNRTKIDKNKLRIRIVDWCYEYRCVWSSSSRRICLLEIILNFLQELEMQVKSHGIHLGSNEYSRLNNNSINSSSYNSQLVNSFLNKSSPTRNNSSSLDIVGKVRIYIPEQIINTKHWKQIDFKYINFLSISRCPMLCLKQPH